MTRPRHILVPTAFSEAAKAARTYVPVSGRSVVLTTVVNVGFSERPLCLDSVHLPADTSQRRPPIVLATKGSA